MNVSRASSPEMTITFLFWITKAPGLQGGNKTLGIVEEQTVFIQKVLVLNAWFKSVQKFLSSKTWSAPTMCKIREPYLQRHEMAQIQVIMNSYLGNKNSPNRRRLCPKCWWRYCRGCGADWWDWRVVVDIGFEGWRGRNICEHPPIHHRTNRSKFPDRSRFNLQESIQPEGLDVFSETHATHTNEQIWP